MIDDPVRVSVQGIKSFNLTGCALTDSNVNGRRVGGVERWRSIIDQPEERFAYYSLQILIIYYRDVNECAVAALCVLEEGRGTDRDKR